MYWNSDDFEKIDEENDLFKKIKSKLWPSGNEKPQHFTLSKKKLPFYRVEEGKQPILLVVEFQPNDNQDNPYDWEKVFVIHTEDDDKWYSLDGTSPPIHELNARFGGIRIDSDAVVAEYLDFFCSFVANNEGIPFSIPLVESDVEFHQNLDFAVAMNASRHYTIFGTLDAPPPTFEDEKKEIQAKVKEFNGIKVKRSEQGQDVDNASEFVNAEAVVLFRSYPFHAEFNISRTGMVDMLNDNPFSQRSEELPLIQYGFSTNNRHSLSMAWRVLTKKKATKKRPELSADELKDKFLKPSASSNDTTNNASNVLTGFLVNEDVKFEDGANYGVIECKDIQFLGSITFDKCHMLHHVSFENCEILGAFSAQNAIFDMGLSLKGSTIHDLQEIKNAPQTDSSDGQPKSTERERPLENVIGVSAAICLDRAQIHRSLDLERVTAYATVRGRHMRVESQTVCRGIQVIPLIAPYSLAKQSEQTNEVNQTIPPCYSPFPMTATKKPVGFDFLESHFLSSLELGPSIDYGIWKNFGDGQNASQTSTVVGEVLLSGIQVDGSIRISGLLVESFANDKNKGDPLVIGQVVNPNFSIDYASISGNIQNFEYGVNDFKNNWQTTIAGNFSLNNTQVKGYIDFRGLHILKDLNFNASSASILFLKHLSIHDEPKKSNGYPHTEQSQPAQKHNQGFYGTTIEGKVNLDSSQIGTVFLQGVSISSQVTIRSAQIGEIRSFPVFKINEIGTEKATGQQSYEIKIHPTKADKLVAHESTVNGEIELVGSEFGDISIENSDIKGNILFFPDNLEAFISVLTDSLNFNYNAKYLENVIKYSNCQNLGDFIKSHIDYEKLQVGVTRNIDILNSEIRGHLNLSNAKVVGGIKLNDSHIEADIRCLSAKSIQGKDIPLLTYCNKFEIESVLCDGDAKLSGLNVGVENNSGEFKGTNAVVLGNTDFVFKKEKSQQHVAKIYGKLDLTAFKTAHLRISGDCIEGHTNDSDQSQITLEHADIGLLDIYDPLPALDLSNIRVTRWKVPGANGNNSSTETEKVLRVVLNNSKPFDSGVYLNVEQSLRLQGKDTEADHIYQDMRKRKLKESTSRGFFGMLPGIWDKYILGYGTAYGTQTRRLLGFWFFLLLIPLLVVLNEPDNIQPTLKVRLSPDSQQYPKTSKPKCDAWNFWEDTLMMGLEITIPLVSFGALEEWEPREHSDTTLSFPSFLETQKGFPPNVEGQIKPSPGLNKTLPFSPKSIAFIFRLISWIIWPLMLTSLTGFIRGK